MSAFHSQWSYSQELPNGLYSDAEVGVDDDDPDHVYVYGLVKHADEMAPLPLAVATQMASAIQAAVAARRAS